MFKYLNKNPYLRTKINTATNKTTFYALKILNLQKIRQVFDKAKVL